MLDAIEALAIVLEPGAGVAAPGALADDLVADTHRGARVATTSGRASEDTDHLSDLRSAVVSYF